MLAVPRARILAGAALLTMLAGCASQPATTPPPATAPATAPTTPAAPPLPPPTHPGLTLAAILQHAFKISEGDIRLGEDRRHGVKKRQAVIVGENVFGKVRAQHHVADGGEREARVRGRR